MNNIILMGNDELNSLTNMLADAVAEKLALNFQSIEKNERSVPVITMMKNR